MKIYTPNPRTNQAGHAIFAVGSFLCLVGLIGYLSIKGIDLKKPILTGDYADSLYAWHATNDVIEVKLVPETDVFYPIINNSEIPNPIEK